MAAVIVDTYLDISIYNCQGQATNVTYSDAPCITLVTLANYYNPYYGGWEAFNTAPLSYKITCPDGFVANFGPIGTTHFRPFDNMPIHGIGTYNVEVTWDGSMIPSYACSGCIGKPVTATVQYVVESRMVDVVFMGYSFVDGTITSTPQLLKNPTHPGEENALNVILRDTSGLSVVNATLRLSVLDPTKTKLTYIGDFVTGGAGQVNMPFTAPSDLGTNQLVINYGGDAGHNPSQYLMDMAVEQGAPIKQDTYMMCYPVERLVLPGGNATIGAGILIVGSSLLPTVPCLVKVYITRPGETEFLYKTVDSQYQWSESLSGSKMGRWTARYAFDGNTLYNGCSCSSWWDVAECNAPVYEHCLDGSDVMTRNCIDGYYVDTGQTCQTPRYPTVMNQCSATPIDNNDLILPWGTVGGRVVLDSGPVTKQDLTTYLSVPIRTEIRAPGGAWQKIADSGHIIYYPTVEGKHEVRFISDTATISGAIYEGTSCATVFWVKSCYDGNFADPYTCPDGQVIYLSVCQNGAYVPTNNVCEIPPDDCTALHPIHPKCESDGYIYDCIDNVWKSTGIACTLPPSPSILPVAVGAVLALVGVAMLLKK